jgi:hypothetical protein
MSDVMVSVGELPARLAGAVRSAWPMVDVPEAWLSFDEADDGDEQLSYNPLYRA